MMQVFDVKVSNTFTFTLFRRPIVRKQLLPILLGLSLLVNGAFAARSVWRRAQSATSSPPDAYWLHRVSEFRTLAKVHPEATVFLGDSLTDGFLVQEYLPELSPLNRGINGEGTVSLLASINESVVFIQPQRVFLLVGTNDIWSERPVSDIVHTYGEILDAIRAGSPKTTVYVQSVLPTRDNPRRPNDTIRALNVALAALAGEKGAAYVDLGSLFTNRNGDLDERYSVDGLHLNGDAYQLWAGKVRTVLAGS